MLVPGAAGKLAPEQPDGAGKPSAAGRGELQGVLERVCCGRTPVGVVQGAKGRTIDAGEKVRPYFNN